MELQTIHKLIQRNWKIRICHIPKAHKAIADFMVKYVAIGLTDIQVFIEPHILCGS